MPTPSPGRSLTGQRAIVTGASSGIGQAIAIAMGRAGADVVVNSGPEGRADNYAGREDGAIVARDAIVAAGSKALVHRADVSREDAGKIICISSVHEVIPWAGHVNYAASRGGAMMLMKSMAQELAPARIRVNSIAPGAIRTPINRGTWETPEAYDALMKLVPYERIGEPDDIARAAVWLASDAADYVTGTTLFVDGGMTLYPAFERGG